MKSDKLRDVGLFFLAGAGLLTGGCEPRQKPRAEPVIERIQIEFSAGGRRYLLSDHVLSQLGSTSSGEVTSDGEYTLGVLADTHGKKENSEALVKKLEDEGVESYIVLGDLCWTMGDPYDIKNNVAETVDSILPIAATGKLVMVMPGNHDVKALYDRAMSSIRRTYHRVIDMQEYPVATLDDLTILALGGCDERSALNIGFPWSPEDFRRVKREAKRHAGDRPLLLASHIPQFYGTQSGIDMTDRGILIGSREYAAVRAQLPQHHAASAHLHESPGIVTRTGQPLHEREHYAQLDLNPGAVWDYMERGLSPSAAVMKFKGKQAMAYHVTLD